MALRPPSPPRMSVVGQPAPMSPVGGMPGSPLAGRPMSPGAYPGGFPQPPPGAAMRPGPAGMRPGQVPPGARGPPPPRGPNGAPLRPTSPPGRPLSPPGRGPSVIPGGGVSDPRANGQQHGPHIMVDCFRQGQSVNMTVLNGYIPDFTELPDCYVEVVLGNQRHKTRTVRNSHYPTWNDQSRYTIKPGDQMFSFRVKDKDLLNMDDFLGEGTLALDRIPNGPSKHVVQIGKRGVVVVGAGQRAWPRPAAHLIKSPWVNEYQPVFYGPSRTLSPQHYRNPIPDFTQSFERPHQPYRFNSPTREFSIYRNGETPPLAITGPANPTQYPTYATPWVNY